MVYAHFSFFSFWSSFFLSEYFEVHPGCSMYPYFTPVYCWRVFLCMDAPVIYSPVDGHLGLVPHFWLLKIKLLWTFLCKFLYGHVPSFPLSKYREWDITWSYDRCVFHYLIKLPNCFQSGSTILKSIQQFMRSFFPHLCQNW